MKPTATPEHPSWWTAEHAAHWESARAAVKESWGKSAGDDKLPPSDAWAAAEPALRFGHGARYYYDTNGKVSWPEVEPKLEADWTKLNLTDSWDHARKAVMHGWDSHARSTSHAGAMTSIRPSASGLGSSSAGDSGSGSGD
jgi:hypothetical protein